MLEITGSAFRHNSERFRRNREPHPRSFQSDEANRRRQSSASVQRRHAIISRHVESSRLDGGIHAACRSNPLSNNPGSGDHAPGTGKRLALDVGEMGHCCGRREPQRITAIVSSGHTAFGRRTLASGRNETVCSRHGFSNNCRCSILPRRSENQISVAHRVCRFLAGQRLSRIISSGSARQLHYRRVLSWFYSWRNYTKIGHSVFA